MSSLPVTPADVKQNFLRFLQRAGNTERVQGDSGFWEIAAFCFNLTGLAVAFVTPKLKTVTVCPAWPETFFSALKKCGPKVPQLEEDDEWPGSKPKSTSLHIL